LDSTLICVPGNSLFVRGNANNDAFLNLADIIYILDYLFTNGPEPPCLASADTDDSGSINISDSVYLGLYLFAEGLPPLSPFPTCGPDPSPDPIGCVGPVHGCPFCP
ncbi:MAG: hypothetical protein V3T77_09910, partial [Planctomycetota bacterium]